MRLVDGMFFLFINTMVMLQTNDVLQIFLNFAALQFLRTIDNVAVQVCLDGYWTKALQETAQDVVDMKLANRHSRKHQLLQTSFGVVLYAVLLFLWAWVHFIKTVNLPATFQDDWYCS